MTVRHRTGVVATTPMTVHPIYRPQVSTAETAAAVPPSMGDRGGALLPAQLSASCETSPSQANSRDSQFVNTGTGDGIKMTQRPPPTASLLSADHPHAQPHIPPPPPPVPVGSAGSASAAARGVVLAGHRLFVVPGIAVQANQKESKRARRSEIERLSRERRQGSVSGMRHELKLLERQYKLLALPDDDKAQGGVIIHPSHVPNLRARYLQLSREASALRDEHKSLRVLLHEKQLFHDSLETLTSPQPSDKDDHALLSWDAAASHATFTPLQPEKCMEIIRDAYKTIAEFDTTRNFVTSGSSVFGWTDKRRLDEPRAQMHFSFTKQFGKNHDLVLETLLTESWEMFRDQQAMRRTIFSAGIHVTLETLQTVSDDILVMRRHTRYLAMGKSFHTVYILFRLRTDRGYTLCFRTIPCPEIQNAMEDGESWIEIFHWLHINRVDSVGGGGGDGDARRPVEVTFGGSLGGSVIKFAMHWMIELVMTLIRWENACVAPMFIASA